MRLSVSGFGSRLHNHDRLELEHGHGLESVARRGIIGATCLTLADGAKKFGGARSLGPELECVTPQNVVWPIGVP